MTGTGISLLDGGPAPKPASRTSAPPSSAPSVRARPTNAA